MSNNLRHEFQQLQQEAEGLTPNKLKLFLITRAVREGVPKSRKMLDKFTFTAWRIDLNEELQEHFLRVYRNQISNSAGNDDIEFQEYAVIDDDAGNKIYTYGLNNVKSFEDVIVNQLQAGVNIPYVTSLSDIKDSLWAYSFAVESGSGSEGKTVYTFRKISGGKVVTDEQRGWKNFLCSFDSNDSKLEVIHKETITFDKRIDCVFLNGHFFALNKSGFETIVGLDEAFHDNAVEVIEALKSTNAIKGLELMLSEASLDKTLLKKLANLARNNNHTSLGEARISKMKEIAGRLKLHLKIEGGQLLIEDKKDMQLVIKMLDQYFLECMQTGEAFGSHAKRRL